MLLLVNGRKLFGCCVRSRLSAGIGRYQVTQRVSSITSYIMPEAAAVAIRLSYFAINVGKLVQDVKRGGEGTETRHLQVNVLRFSQGRERNASKKTQNWSSRHDCRLLANIVRSSQAQNGIFLSFPSREKLLRHFTGSTHRHERYETPTGTLDESLMRQYLSRLERAHPFNGVLICTTSWGGVFLP